MRRRAPTSSESKKDKRDKIVRTYYTLQNIEDITSISVFRLKTYIKKHDLAHRVSLSGRGKEIRLHKDIVKAHFINPPKEKTSPLRRKGKTEKGYQFHRK